MELKRRVALGGSYLDAANSKICVQSIELADAKENITAVSAAAGFGQRITGARRDMADVVVRFSIDIKKTSLASRAAALEAANAWAAKATNGAWLTVNYRSARRIWVRLVQAPGEGNLWEWTKAFSITFRAYGVPYWEDASASTKAIGTDDDEGSDTITVAGSAPAQIEFTALNTSGSTINTLSITCGGKTMSFASLGLADGETLSIDHDNGLLRIRRLTGGAYVSAMAARTSASADDFTALPGSVSVSYTAGGNCTVTASWRARHL